MSSIDEDKKRKRELIEARKHRYDMPEQALYDSDPNRDFKPKTVRQKIANFWFHSKWFLIAGVAIVSIVVWIIVPFLFPQRYDTSFSIVSEDNFSSWQSFILPALNSVLEDYDGNGKKELEYIAYEIPEDLESANPDTLMASLTRLSGKLSNGTDFLFMCDEVGYANLKKFNCEFLDLSEITDSENVDGDKYRLKGTAFGDSLGISGVGGDYGLFLCFIDSTGFSSTDWDSPDIIEARRRQMDYFQNIIAVG